MDVYRLPKDGPISRDFGLRDQMRSAAVSIPSNIAEGDERDTNRDCVRFLYIAKGSLAAHCARAGLPHRVIAGFGEALRYLPDLAVPAAA